MATGLILDELDLNLSALATGLVFIVVFLLGAHAIPSGHVGVLGGAITGGSGLLEVLVGGSGFLLAEGSHVGHGERKQRAKSD